MTHTSIQPLDALSVLNTIPGCHLILLPDAPHYTIVGATDAYLAATYLKREEAIGQGVFETHTDNLANPGATGVKNLSASLAFVVQQKIEHRMADQRYDIRNPKTGVFEFRVWSPLNKPVLDGQGRVQYIIHTVEDITDKARLQEAGRVSEQKLHESEARFRSFIEEAPIATCLFVGREMVIEVANEAMIQVWGKGPDVTGKRLAEALPELKGQHFLPLLDELFITGHTYSAKGGRADLVVNGKLQTFYFDYDFKPLRKADGTIYAILETAINVTGQVLAQKKIAESQRSLLTLFEESPVGIATLSAGDDLVFETANEFYARLVDRKPEDIIGKPLLMALPEIEGQGFDNLLKNVIATGTAYSASEVPVRVVRDGRLDTLYLNFTFQPRKDGQTVTGILVVANDVTEHVLARKKIEQSEQYVRNIFSNSPVAHLVYVGENIVLQEANEKMFEILGRTKEIVGQPILDTIPEFRKTAIAEHYHGVLATGRPHEEQGRQVTIIKNGEPYHGYYDFTYKPLTDTEGRVYGTICSAVDVTEEVTARLKLEEKESALEAALEQVRLSKEAAELGTFDLDLEKGDMHWDKRCRTLFGISHNQPVSFELDFVERLHPDDRERVAEVIDRAYAPSLSNGDYDVEYRTIGAEDGIERWVRAKGKVYFNSTNKPVRFIGSVLDITPQVGARQRIESLVAQRTSELAAANENLSALNKELQRSNANLEEFAHAASHDLKEPIRKITFFSHQLKDQLADRLRENEEFSFGRIEHATERMGNLIDDLLLYSHVSQRPLETEAIDLNQKLQRVLEDLELDIQEKKAVVNVGKLPVVQGYRRQLQQLFQNLISNALKYSKADVPPQINITAGVVKLEGKEYNVINVEDNGIGFDQQYEDKIFQMFSRLHGKSEYSGTGVGLSIVKKVIENHNGFIQVQSEVAKGSTFMIHLPV